MKPKIKVDTTGLKKLQKKLDKAVKNASGNVRLSELLSDSFMRKNTKFSSFNDLLNASGLKIENEDDLKAIPSDEFDKYIKSCTKFKSWDEMLNQAASEHFARNFKL